MFKKSIFCMLIIFGLIFISGCSLESKIVSEDNVSTLAENHELSFEIIKAWENEKISWSILANNQVSYTIPLHLEIQNHLNQKLTRVRPRMEWELEMQYWPSIVVSCIDQSSELNYSQNIFQLFPGLIEAWSWRTYTPKILWNTNWGNTTIWENAKILVDSKWRTPRFIYTSNMQEWEEITWSINLNCKLFVSKWAWVNDCDCHIDEDRNFTDYNCFRSCYPEVSTQDQNYFNVDYYNPSDDWIEIDQSSIVINYEWVATKCDFGCDMEYEFSI